MKIMSFFFAIFLLRDLFVFAIFIEKEKERIGVKETEIGNIIIYKLYHREREREGEVCVCVRNIMEAVKSSEH